MHEIGVGFVLQTKAVCLNSFSCYMIFYCNFIRVDQLFMQHDFQSRIYPLLLLSYDYYIPKYAYFTYMRSTAMYIFITSI